MKGKIIFPLILAIVVADQILKFYIKLNYVIGEEHIIFPNWFYLHFIENEGMAWGWKWGGMIGKYALTLFRLVAVIWGSFYVVKAIKNQYNFWFMLVIALIYAGALGNLIDSLFYGLIFDSSYNPYHPTTPNILAKAFTGEHYGGLMQGKVVDMLYFPLIEGHFPQWFPFWRGEYFIFFSPIFNLADSAVSIGAFLFLYLISFKKQLLPPQLLR